MFLKCNFNFPICMSICFYRLLLLDVEMGAIIAFTYNGTLSELYGSSGTKDFALYNVSYLSFSGMYISCMKSTVISS